MCRRSEQYERGQEDSCHRDDADDERHHGLRAVAVLRVHACEVRDNPEIAVVGMRYRHSTSTDGHDGQQSGHFRIETQCGHHGG